MSSLSDAPVLLQATVSQFQPDPLSPRATTTPQLYWKITVDDESRKSQTVGRVDGQFRWTDTFDFHMKEDSRIKVSLRDKSNGASLGRASFTWSEIEPKLPLGLWHTLKVSDQASARRAASGNIFIQFNKKISLLAVVNSERQRLTASTGSAPSRKSSKSSSHHHRHSKEKSDKSEKSDKENGEKHSSHRRGSRGDEQDMEKKDKKHSTSSSSNRLSVTQSQTVDQQRKSDEKARLSTSDGHHHHHHPRLVPETTDKKATKKEKKKEVKIAARKVLAPLLSGVINPLKDSTDFSRGRCAEKGCDCEFYIPENDLGGACRNCGHESALHNPPVDDSATDLRASTDLKVISPDNEAGEDHELKQLSRLLKKGHQATSSSTWEIDCSELVLKSNLGEGTSAKVYKGLYRNQEVAVKILKDKIENKILADFQSELEMMKDVRSPFLVYFFGAFLRPQLVSGVVLEFCHKGSLYDALQTEVDGDPRPASQIEDIGWDRVLKTIESSCKGIACLHSWKPQIVHRDLKSQNLMIDDNWNVKVGDFGLSRYSSSTFVSTLGKLRGTYAYCAPEVYFGKPFTPKSDVYSMAIIMWELVYRCMKREYQQPYAEFPQLIFPFQIIIQTAKNNMRPTIVENCPKDLQDLIRQCWDTEAENRPTMLQIVDKIKMIYGLYHKNQKAWDDLIDPIPVPQETTDNPSGDSKEESDDNHDSS